MECLFLDISSRIWEGSDLELGLEQSERILEDVFGGSSWNLTVTQSLSLIQATINRGIWMFKNVLNI